MNKRVVRIVMWMILLLVALIVLFLVLALNNSASLKVVGTIVKVYSSILMWGAIGFLFYNMGPFAKQNK